MADLALLLPSDPTSSDTTSPGPLQYKFHIPQVFSLLSPPTISPHLTASQASYPSSESHHNLVYAHPPRSYLAPRRWPQVGGATSAMPTALKHGTMNQPQNAAVGTPNANDAAQKPLERRGHVWLRRSNSGIIVLHRKGMGCLE